MSYDEFRRKGASGSKVVGALRSLVNARGLQLECVRVLHEGLLVPVLLCCSETMIWREKMFRVMVMQMDNLRGLLDIKYRMLGLESYAEK